MGSYTLRSSSRKSATPLRCNKVALVILPLQRGHLGSSSCRTHSSHPTSPPQSGCMTRGGFEISRHSTQRKDYSAASRRRFAGAERFSTTASSCCFISSTLSDVSLTAVNVYLSICYIVASRNKNRIVAFTYYKHDEL